MFYYTGVSLFLIIYLLIRKEGKRERERERVKIRGLLPHLPDYTWIA